VTGRECWRSEVQSRPIGEALAFSPDGSWLALDFNQSDVWQLDLWDARTGQRSASLEGHRHSAISLTFSADSRRLASVSSDGTALVWDVEAITGRRAGRLDNAQQEQLWADLAGDGAPAAHAIDSWQAAPTEAVPFLRRKLRPAAAVLAERVTPLVTKLDSPTFAVREADGRPDGPRRDPPAHRLPAHRLGRRPPPRRPGRGSPRSRRHAGRPPTARRAGGRRPGGAADARSGREPGPTAAAVSAARPVPVVRSLIGKPRTPGLEDSTGALIQRPPG
jgi:hypothetical protein